MFSVTASGPTPRIRPAQLPARQETYPMIPGGKYMKYDVIVIGAGPGGIFSAYELTQRRPDLKVAVFEAGHALNKRRCPIDG